MTKPFFVLDDGIGVLLNGTTAICGEKRTAIINNENGEEVKCKAISFRPLKEPKKSGLEIQEDDVVIDAGYVCIAFANDEAIDSLITTLQKLKEIHP